MRNLLLLFFLFPLGITAQPFHAVGYLPYYRFGLKDQLSFEKLTILNLAFLNPDSQGDWSIGGEDIDPIVQKARLDNPSIQVYISVAGGGLTPEWAAAYDTFMQPAMRSQFIHSLIEYVELHQLDGVDMDLEWNYVNALYSPFVIDLRDSLDAHGKGLTAALPGTYRYPDISNEALAVFDYVHIMAYDLTGPWAPNQAGPHSPVSFSQQSINHWLSQGVPAEQLTLGVPFYGYDFTDPSHVNAFTFHTLVAEDSNYAFLDQVGQRYYNGIPTIRAKTQMAFQQVGGIMIWEIGQDALGSQANYSLLATIDQERQILSALDPADLPQIQVFPNPFAESLTIESGNFAGSVQLALISLGGQAVLHQTLDPGLDQLRIPTAYLAAGVYFLRISHKSGIVVQKLVKY